MKVLPVAALLFGLTALAACTTTDTPTTTAPETPANPNAKITQLDIPSGQECGTTLSQFKAVLDNDLRTGHVNRPVYDKAIGDLRPALAACKAGRNVEGIALTNATKRKFGYPVSESNLGEVKLFGA